MMDKDELNRLPSKLTVENAWDVLTQYACNIAAQTQTYSYSERFSELRAISLTVEGWLRHLSPENQETVLQPMKHYLQNHQTGNQPDLAGSTTPEEKCIALLFALITDPPQVL
jgi:hypothetical protein